MLTSAPVSASLPVVDLERAKKFYQDTLSLKLAEEKANEFAMFECGNGTNLVLFPRAPTKADHTVGSIKGAWFVDTEGNILGIFQRIS